jgi:hypothetical protein
MSIEIQIEHLHKAINRLCDVLESKTVPAQAPVAQAAQPEEKAKPKVDKAPKVESTLTAPAPTAPAPTPVPVASAPAMPAPPVFEAPAPAAPAGVPFTDAKGMMSYVVTSYNELGKEKGAQIQGVLTTLGYHNINDIKPEHYSALYAGIEALKSQK